MVGFVVAGLAIWMIAAGDNPEAVPASAGTIWLAVLSGAGFGVYFVALKYAAAGGLVCICNCQPMWSIGQLNSIWPGISE